MICHDKLNNYPTLASKKLSDTLDTSKPLFLCAFNMLLGCLEDSCPQIHVGQEVQKNVERSRSIFTKVERVFWTG